MDWARILAYITGTDFFSVEVLTLRGLVTYYVLFFIHLESREVEVSGITPHPNERWMKQMARNVTMDGWGFLDNCRYLIHDRDTKYCQSFRDTIESGDVKTLPLPARSPNLNAFAERWVRSVKDEWHLLKLETLSLRGCLDPYGSRHRNDGHFCLSKHHSALTPIYLFRSRIRCASFARSVMSILV